MPPSTNHLIQQALVLSILVAIGQGCGSKDSGRRPLSQASTQRKDPETHLEIEKGLNEIVNQAESRYKPVKYDYDEGLLKIADQAESFRSGKAAGVPPRFMPKLDEVEELDHFRETIRRWEEQNGHSFRASIDPLIVEVAERKPGEAFHPEFHKRFSVVFDSFIPIEVAEARQRRNRAIRTEAKALLGRYRASQPEVVKDFEVMLDQQYPQTLLTPNNP